MCVCVCGETVTYLHKQTRHSWLYAKVERLIYKGAVCVCVCVCMCVCTCVCVCVCVCVYECVNPFLLYRNEYLCFQKITKLEYSIPDGFPDNAKEVVTKLLVSLIMIITLGRRPYNTVLSGMHS